MDLLREMHKHRDALVESHGLEEEVGTDAEPLLDGAARGTDSVELLDVLDGETGPSLGDELHPALHRGSLESTQSQRQAQMELYDYAQRRMSRRLIVDVRGLDGATAGQEDVDADDEFHDKDMEQTCSQGSVDSDHVDDHNVMESISERQPLASSSKRSRADERRSPRPYGSVDVGADDHDHHREHPRGEESLRRKPSRMRRCDWLFASLHQLPAIAVVALLWLMMALPFGVAYFPIGWSSSIDDPDTSGAEVGPSSALNSTAVTDSPADGAGIHGPFPLPGKEALGIRMCLFATIVGQLVMTYTSRFDNPIAFQLLENVPFYHALASIVIQDLGYGMDALATLVFLFGLSSVLVGSVFFMLGRFKLGRLVYFFPSHVLVGCIGGIGIFIAITSVSVTNNVDVTFDADGWRSFVDNIHLFGIVVAFESVLRVLMSVLRDSKGRPTFALLAPVYFCSIVPIFYLGMYLLGTDIEAAREAGYFFPSPVQAATDCLSGDLACQQVSSRFPSSAFDGHILDMFRILDVRRIAWTTVIKSLGTVVAMVSFSLIHVPINIPAFAVSSNVDTDMNAELLAHGYSNILSGLFGGLQTIMTYSFSVLYMKSGGKGRASSLGVTFVGVLLFVFGPQISAYIPRCMAGTLLLHVGLDLFLEGIVDSWGSYDYLEYAGIVFIAAVMTVSGMTSALLAGIIAALSTYAVQSITNLDPIFRIMSASTLQSSSAWIRSPAANAILDSDETGRKRVLVVQLQGHLFFGNVASLTDTIKHSLNVRRGLADEPYIVILDFTLVVGMDSSAAHAIAKLKRIMHTLFDVEVTMFVSGSHRSSFPCDYALAEALSKDEDNKNGTTLDFNDVDVEATPKPARARRGSVCITPGSKAMEASRALRKFPKYHVCNSMDKALEFAEDVLIARSDPFLFQKEKIRQLHPLEHSDAHLTIDDEKTLATMYLENLAASSPIAEREVKQAVAKILSLCRREVFTEHELIWKQGDDSDSMKVLVRGTLLAKLGGTDVTEVINQGSTIGELGLVQGGRRLSSVVCSSVSAVAYTLDRASWEQLVRKHPGVARVVDHIVIRYLSQRVQHVSNRIFETRCLPI